MLTAMFCAARMLAMGYRIERKIDSDELADYADAARQFGITRARGTQLMSVAAGG